MRRDLSSICVLTIGLLSAVSFAAPPREWEFKPAKQDNKPVTVWISLQIKFKLDGEKKDKGTDTTGKRP